ncbi:hypothetical protein ACFL2D_02975 [Patescibacteria group bacterium]
MSEENSKRCNIQFTCGGRNERGQSALQEQITVTLRVSLFGTSMISLDVDCPHNTGGHGERCKASHPEQDKVGSGITCPYTIDLPYAIDRFRGIEEPTGHQFVNPK